MDGPSSAKISWFEGFRLDRRGGVLSRRDENGDFVPVEIGSRALDILGVLVDRPGDLISRAEIIDTVWPETVVDDSNLNVQLAALRRILDHDRREGSCIQTVPGRGYRFVATVTRSDVGLPQGGVRPPPRLSIVVLPFTNLSDDREQQYFADGITDDLTTDLSRLAGMFVISRNTAFTYRDKPIDTRQIGRELGIRYVLEGSVRRSAKQMRINAQLIDAETDAHLWAERFDRDIGEFLALQNEITGRIANTLRLELFAAEAARTTADPDALDYILRGRAAFRKGPSRENHADIIRLFERALALDPRSVDALTLLANALANRAREHLTDSRAADIERAEGLVKQALEISPSNPLAHLAKGQLLRTQRRCEEAIPEYEMVLESDRNMEIALFSLGICKVLVGSVNEAIPMLQQSVRLDPRNPFIVYRYDWLGSAYLLQSRTDEAIVWFEKARSVNPGIAGPRAHLAAAYGLRGESERAAAELSEAQRLSGDDSYSSIAHVTPAFNWGTPKTRALFETTFFAGLRKAGMPEQ
jgi:adenylate cyclase